MKTSHVTSPRVRANKQGVSRRQLFPRLAAALAAVGSPAVFGAPLQNAAKTEETLQRKLTGTARFLNSAGLFRLIRNAPEEKPGTAGLYSVKLSTESEYPVIGVRRTVVGIPEVHEEFLDVQFVLAGAAILVTGGKLVDGTITAPGEIRGGTISDGESRKVRKGDFLIIPQGVPHWVKTLEDKEFLYIVVKVPARR